MSVGEKAPDGHTAKGSKPGVGVDLLRKVVG